MLMLTLLAYNRGLLRLSHRFYPSPVAVNTRKKKKLARKPRWLQLSGGDDARAGDSDVCSVTIISIRASTCDSPVWLASVWRSGPEPFFSKITLASIAPRHNHWAMHRLLPRDVLFQAVNLVDQSLKSMLISKS